MKRNWLLFPYGKAAGALLFIALTTGTVLFWLQHGWEKPEADLVFTTFAQNHYEAYLQVVGQFEAQHQCKVQMQLVPARGLQSRLQSAFLVNAEVPDVVEILNGSMGYFTQGPLEDVGFLDLTDWLHESGIYDRMVASRFTLWSSRGRIFGMPHDVHPVTLAYRADIVEGELGIDVGQLDTWDKFTALGRRLTIDKDGDGVIDQYMIDLPADGGGALELLNLQHGSGLFDEHGNVAMDSDVIVDTIEWYIHQTRGENKIAFPAGGGQTLSKAMLDGFALFYFCPDWRTQTFEKDVPTLSGKMKIMPLPAWQPGGRRTSTWGGTGLCITKACQKPELAKELAKFFYLNNEDLGKRFKALNIVPPVKDAWDLPVFDEPREYWCGQPIGRILSSLCPEVPPDYATPYLELAREKLKVAFLNAAQYYDAHGDDGLREAIQRELTAGADYVRRVANRNVFLTTSHEGGR